MTTSARNSRMTTSAVALNNIKDLLGEIGDSEHPLQDRVHMVHTLTLAVECLGRARQHAGL